MSKRDDKSSNKENDLQSEVYTNPTDTQTSGKLIS